MVKCFVLRLRLILYKTFMQFPNNENILRCDITVISFIFLTHVHVMYGELRGCHGIIIPLYPPWYYSYRNYNYLLVYTYIYIYIYTTYIWADVIHLPRS